MSSLDVCFQSLINAGNEASAGEDGSVLCSGGLRNHYGLRNHFHYGLRNHFRLFPYLDMEVGGELDTQMGI